MKYYFQLTAIQPEFSELCIYFIAGWLIGWEEFRKSVQSMNNTCAVAA
jgi:hypothetical protein